MLFQQHMPCHISSYRSQPLKCISFSLLFLLVCLLIQAASWRKWLVARLPSSRLGHTMWVLWWTKRVWVWIREGSTQWHKKKHFFPFFHILYFISKMEDLWCTEKYYPFATQRYTIRPGADQSSKAAFCKSAFAESKLTFGKSAFARSRFAFRQSIFAYRKQWSGQVQRAKCFLLRRAKTCSKAFLLFARLVCAMSYL